MAVVGGRGLTEGLEGGRPRLTPAPNAGPGPAPTRQVSPHEFMQAVIAASKRRFTIEAQADALEFLTWLLNALHAGLVAGPGVAGAKGGGRSVITDCFQARGGAAGGQGVGLTAAANSVRRRERVPPIFDSVSTSHPPSSTHPPHRACFRSRPRPGAAACPRAAPTECSASRS